MPRRFPDNDDLKWAERRAERRRGLAQWSDPLPTPLLALLLTLGFALLWTGGLRLGAWLGATFWPHR
jgi:hypothetical protein